MKVHTVSHGADRRSKRVDPQQHAQYNRTDFNCDVFIVRDVGANFTSGRDDSPTKTTKAINVSKQLDMYSRHQDNAVRPTGSDTTTSGRLNHSGHVVTAVRVVSAAFTEVQYGRQETQSGATDADEKCPVVHDMFTLKADAVVTRHKATIQSDTNPNADH